MTDCLISVVIPTFNRAHFIGQAISSVAQQTYRPIEVLVVDDGSDDGTESVVATLRDSNRFPNVSLKYFRQDRKGGNAARNLGIQHAAGEWIAFLDSDDQWQAEKLEKQIRLVQSQPQFRAVYCGLQSLNLETGETRLVHNDYRSGNLLSDLLVRDVTAPTSAYMVHRDVFAQVGGFDCELEARQDWEMWIRIATKFQIGAVPEPLTIYCEHNGPRTNSDPLREIRAYQRIRSKYHPHLSAESRRVQHAAEASFYKRMGRVYLRNDLGRFKALRYYLRAVWLQPSDFDHWAALGGWFLPGSLRRGLSSVIGKYLSRFGMVIRSH
jgi:glycosyltransferase involved in cell wall biosynthesis